MPRSKGRKKPSFLPQNTVVPTTPLTVTASGSTASETQEELFARIAQEATTKAKAVERTHAGMAAPRRNRNGGVNQDADEESSLWAQIKRDIAKCSIVRKRYDAVSRKIVEMEAEMALSMFGFSSLFHEPCHILWSFLSIFSALQVYRNIEPHVRYLYTFFVLLVLMLS